MTKLNSGSLFESKFSYSRAVSVNGWIYLSLTAGRNPETKEIPEDITEQTQQVFLNIESALISLGASLQDVIVSRVYIPDPEDVPAVLEVIGNKYRGIDPATTICCAPLTSPIYKVEIEVTAYRGTELTQIERITTAG